MKFFRALLLQFIALSGFVYASSDSDKSREFYLCVKVKKNPVEQCSNKIFGKKRFFETLHHRKSPGCEL